MSDLELTSLAIAFASEKDIRRTLAHQSGVLEWETLNWTFIKSNNSLCIIRTGALGGDTREVHGGWRYLTKKHMDTEWAEISRVARAYKRGTQQDASTVRA